MSKSIRDDKDRRITELEALVEGQAVEIARLSDEFDERDQFISRLFLDLQKATKKGAQ